MPGTQTRPYSARRGPFLFTDCGCCGKRVGGSTTDPFKVCKTCDKAGCKPRVLYSSKCGK